MTRVLASLTPREERILHMRFGIGMTSDHTLEEVALQIFGNARAHPADRDEGIAESSSTRADQGCSGGSSIIDGAGRVEPLALPARSPNLNA